MYLFIFGILVLGVLLQKYSKFGEKGIKFTNLRNKKACYLEESDIQNLDITTKMLLNEIKDMSVGGYSRSNKIPGLLGFSKYIKSSLIIRKISSHASPKKEAQTNPGSKDVTPL